MGGWQRWRRRTAVWFIFRMRMRKVLHLLTRVEDEWPGKLIEREKALPQTEHEIVDLRKDKPDYVAVVRKIFEADSVQVW